jgi:hypothetical protein
MNASLLDVIVIAVYLVGITAFGIRVGSWSGWPRAGRKKGWSSATSSGWPASR